MKIPIVLIGLVVLVDCLNVNLYRTSTKFDGLRRLLQDFERTVRKDNERRVTSWLKVANEKLRKFLNQVSLAEYGYETDLNDYNARKLEKISSREAVWQKRISKLAKQKLQYKGLSNDTRRQLRLLSIDSDPLNPKDVRRMEKIKSSLQQIYGKATVVKDGKVFNLDPDLNDIMSKSRDPQQLEWAWKNWRDVSGKQMPHLYSQLVEYLNMGAIGNGYNDAGDVWRQTGFDETPNLVNMAERLWKDLKPMYLQLHTYVRKRLKEYYLKEKPDYDFPNDGSIPAHLLGNMWAQEWQNIFDIVKPFPEIREEDYDEVIKREYNVGSMFRRAEEFYTSIGLYNMTEDFWKRSMFIRPQIKDRKVQCHASAFDFYDKDKFRIKMCTEVNMDDFETIHHEMGHIEYFMSYSNQSAIYRDGANCACHEAIGDTVALSVHTRKHLRKIGILTGTEKKRTSEEQKKVDINYLMRKALYKIAFLPFGYMVDKWRWDVFNTRITPEKYNKEWWKMRLQYQGVTAPVPRSKEDFDPGAKFHIPSNSPYICYFVSFIIQFQFYEALCRESGYDTVTQPLYQCDFYQSKEAGQKLKNMLKMGKSQPWKKAMEAITNQEEISTSSIKTYFQPLIDWLKEQNKGEKIGWGDAKINWQGG